MTIYYFKFKVNKEIFGSQLVEEMRELGVSLPLFAEDWIGERVEGEVPKQFPSLVVKIGDTLYVATKNPDDVKLIERAIDAHKPKLPIEETVEILRFGLDEERRVVIEKRELIKKLRVMG